jgi:hypothetical protein
MELRPVPPQVLAVQRPELQSSLFAVSAYQEEMFERLYCNRNIVKEKIRSIAKENITSIVIENACGSECPYEPELQ